MYLYETCTVGYTNDGISHHPLSVDGSVSLHPIAKIEDGDFTYINGEDNATVWTGKIQ